MKIHTSLPVMLIALFVQTALPALAVDYNNLAITAYDKHILPRYKKLSVSALQLENALKKLCNMPDKPAHEQVKSAYKKLLISWSGVEHLRFGPVTQEYRYERFAYWPDIKGRGLKNVRKVLFKKDTSVLSVDSLKRKSVALQGLTALEFLLYGKEGESLQFKSDKSKFRCAYAHAIAGNLSMISEDIVVGWGDGRPYVDAFLRPAKGKTYVTSKEVTLVLFQAYITGYARIRSLKILRPLGLPGKKRINARLAPYWRSGLTIDVLIANMDALKHMYLVGGFSKLVADKEPMLKRSVEISIDNGIRVLSSINEPVTEIFSVKGKQSKYKFIASILGVMRSHTGSAILKAADLTIGFNADDGD